MPNLDIEQRILHKLPTELRKNLALITSELLADQRNSKSDVPVTIYPIESIRLHLLSGIGKIGRNASLKAGSLSCNYRAMPVPTTAPRTLYDKIWDDHVV